MGDNVVQSFAELMRRGSAALAAGRLDEAAALFREASKSGDPAAFNKLALALAAAGAYDAAIDAARQAVELAPHIPELLNNLGNTLQMAGKLDQAIDAYQKTLELRPGHLEARLNLGHARSALGQYDEAVAVLEGVLAERSDWAAAWMNLGTALQGKGELDGAITAAEKVIQLRPNFPDGHWNLSLALKDAGRLDEAVRENQRALEMRPNSKMAGSLLILLQYHPAYDSAALAEAQRNWYRRYIEGRIVARSDHANDPSPERRLRVGYVSPDFRHHPVGHNVLPLLEQHDHRNFEIFCYSNVARPDEFTKRLRGYADCWRDIRSLNDDQAAELIRSDQIDVLVDLALHTGENRIEIFARKPAPVQFTFAGYPGTTGLPALDYRLTDSYLDPAGETDQVAFEKPIRIRSFWCYEPLGDEPDVNELPALSNGYVTFGCLNNFCKINDGVLELWVRVMVAVPGSRLLILSKRGAHRDRVRSVLQARGVAGDRVEFVDPGPRVDYLKLYHRIDLGLDTFPYNGHTTSLDSLWMGVPVVTLIGNTALSRGGFSLLSNLGMRQLAAADADEFVRVACELANDLPHLAQTRATLREKMSESVLTDKEGFARSIEAAFRGVWREWCASARKNAPPPSADRAKLENELVRAVRAHQSGKLAEAEAGYRRVLDQSPGEADALHLLGVVCHQLGWSEKAVKSIGAAIDAKPDVADFHTNLGLALLALGRIDEAIASQRRAIALNPEHAAAQCNLGLALAGDQQHEPAIESYRKALSLKPDYPEAHFNLGRSLHALGELEVAAEALRKATELQPGFVEAYVELGNVLVERGELSEALRVFRDAVALKPEIAEIQYNVANVLSGLGRFDEAITLYRGIVARKPDCAEAHLNLGKALKERGEWELVIRCYRRAVELAPSARFEQNLITSHEYLPNADAAEIIGGYRAWNERYAKPLREPGEVKSKPLDGRRLRIGYVSPDFRQHPVGLCFLPVIAGHDADEVEVCCYSDVIRPDAVTERIRGHSHLWRDTARLTDEQLARLVREDRIDVLVDLAGHTSGSRLLAFARKPAPVQVTWLGWPGTTGMDAMDYRLSDPYLDPPGGPNESLYSERTIRLPDCFWCYGEPEIDIPVGRLPGSDQTVMFGSLNAVFKTNDTVFETWTRVLLSVSRSRLLMRAPVGATRGRIVRKFEALGVDPDRLEFAGRVDQLEYWRLYHRIDIGLDTFPYNGHTTSMDALWMGVPVVSLVGRLPSSRAGLSILSNLGMQDLATQTPEQYVACAIALARNLHGLAEIRQGLRERMRTSALMNGRRFARELETKYRLICIP